MLGLDFSELLIIGVVALVVVGPKELPQLLRTVGQWVAKARRMASEFQGQMNEAIREAELDDVKKHVDDLRSLSPKALIADQFASVTRTLDDVRRDTDAELAKIEAGVSFPGLSGPQSAGSAMSAFMVEDVAPVMSAAEATARIDGAAPPVGPLEPPVFDVEPAPGGPEPMPLLAAGETEAEPVKKDAVT